jgi:hypothetical protein
MKSSWQCFAAGLERPLRHAFIGQFEDKHAIARLTAQGNCSYFVLMPETNGEKRGPYTFTLLAAYEQGRLVRARCSHCNIRRVYDPGDLKQLVGNVGIEALRRQMRCEACRSSEYMDVEFWIPTEQGVFCRPQIRIDNPANASIAELGQRD